MAGLGTVGTAVAHCAGERDALDSQGIHVVSLVDGQNHRRAGCGDPLVMGRDPAGRLGKVEVWVDLVYGLHHS